MHNLIPWLCCKTQPGRECVCVGGGGGGVEQPGTSHTIIQPHILPPHHAACMLQPRRMRQSTAAVTILEGGRSQNARSPLGSLSPFFCAVAQKRFSPTRFPERFHRALSGPIVHHLEDDALVRSLARSTTHAILSSLCEPTGKMCAPAPDLVEKRSQLNQQRPAQALDLH